jgi:hypothetical protein
MLFTLPTSVFSYDLREINGEEFLNFNYYIQLSFVQGYMLGSYTVLQRLAYDYGLDLELMSLHGDTDETILKEICEFYLNTQRYEYPVYVVIYIRNAWKYKDIPPWDEVKGDWK